MVNILNQRAERKEEQYTYTINPENAEVYEPEAGRSLFMTMAGIRIGQKSFYADSDEKLARLERALDGERDPVFKAAISAFLAKAVGIKFTPVIALTRLAMSLKGDTNPENQYIRNAIRRAIWEVFDRPDKFANAIGYLNYHGLKGTELPPFYRRALRNRFERLKPYSLRKGRLASRQVKTRDVIKLLRPRARTAELAALYKAIIENSNEASIRVGTTAVDVLSNTEVSTEQKREFLTNRIATLNFNELVRNLRNVDLTPQALAELSGRFVNDLRVVAGIPQVKVANPFDLLTAGLAHGDRKLLGVVDEALTNWASQLDLGLTNMKVVVQIDRSGSMGPGYGTDDGDAGWGIGSQLLTMLYPALRNSQVDLGWFGSQTHWVKTPPHYARLADASLASLHEVLTKDFHHLNQGTAIADMMREAVQRNPDFIIVITDDVSWADNYGPRVPRNNIPTLVVNTDPQSDFTSFDPNEPHIVRIAGLDPKIFYYIPMLTDFNAFRQWVINWAFS